MLNVAAKNVVKYIIWLFNKVLKYNILPMH